MVAPDIAVKAFSGAGLVRIGRRALVAVHRWIGVGSAFMFVMWFASGLVMLYAPYPSLTPRERIAGAQAIDWSRVRLDPAAALAKAGAHGWPRRFTLEMLDGQPVYRIADFRNQTLSAVDGHEIEGVDGPQAAAIAKAFRRWSGPVHVTSVERDQWTVAEDYDAHRPLFKASFDDPARTVLYVSSNTGEVVLDTTRRERFWSRFGTVPHWLYFTALRQHGQLWTQVILWTSGLGIVGALTGLWNGLLRLKRRSAGGGVSPYRGWMRWHHIGGLVSGLTILTWVFSGWMSMNPNHWLEAQGPDYAGLVRYAGHNGLDFPAGRGAGPSGEVREGRFVWVAGRPLAILTGPDMTRTVLDARTGQPAGFTVDQLFDNARRYLPGAHLVRRQVMTREDVYWYAHHAAPRLPMLRAVFDDPQATWLYIDPLTGQVAGAQTRSDRIDRWLFNFLHDFDLPILLQTRPTWDVVVVLLLAGGLLTSVTAVVIGWRRLAATAAGFTPWRRSR